MRIIATLLLALALATGGVLLARYAEADDAPGGVVIGGIIVVAAVAIGATAFRAKKS